MTLLGSKRAESGRAGGGDRDGDRDGYDDEEDDEDAMDRDEVEDELKSARSAWLKQDRQTKGRIRLKDSELSGEPSERGPLGQLVRALGTTYSDEGQGAQLRAIDRKSTRLNSSH